MTVLRRRIEDWTGAYTNGANIAGGDRWPAAWVEPAKTLRADLTEAGRAKLDIAYGNSPRNRFDLFLPEGAPRGLVVYVHGGYWLHMDNRFGSHLAGGALAHGYAVAMPTYTLCPDIRIAGIVREVGAAITAATDIVAGPLMLTGHSAGGHLVCRMVSQTSPLTPAVRERIRHVLSISGLHDLRPLMGAAMNETLHIDEAEAIAESPALLRPMENARLTCWVGGGERSEFIRQSALLANVWTGLGAETALVVEPDRHHFNILDGLADADHPLTRCLLGI